VYSGDNTFAPSTSSPLVVPVAPAPVANIVLTATPDPARTGQQVILAVTMSALGGIAPTGSIEFYDGPVLLTSVAATPVVTFTTLFAAGIHHIVAIYKGDANYLTSSASYDLAINMAEGFSVALVADRTQAAFGEAITVTATVTTPPGTTG